MIVAVLLLIAGSWACARRMRGAPAAAIASRLFVVVTGSIVIAGEIASAFGRLGDARFWIAGEAGALFGAIGLLRAIDRSLRGSPIQGDDGAASTLERAVLGPMTVAAVAAGLTNLAVLLLTAPRAWDGLTYHLARAAYYLQHGSLAFYDANFWAQVVQPHDSALLTIYAYLASSRVESWMTIWQYVAYWTAVVVTGGIARETGLSRRQAWFAALAFALLTQALMQAATANNDMILAAYAAIAVYGILRYRRDPNPVHLAIAAAAAGLGLGTKSSFALNVPLLGALAVYALARPGSARAWRTLVMSSVAAAALFVLPSGYVANYRLFGSVIGPSSVVAEHLPASLDAGGRVREGAKNVLRFGIEFLSLDGLPRIAAVNRAQRALRAIPAAIVPLLGVDLEHPVSPTRGGFRYERIASAHEVHSYWGVIGFAMVWPAVFAAALRRSVPRDQRLLAWLTIGFLLLQAFFTTFDPWRGRYFVTAAVFASPLAARWLAARRPCARAYLAVVVWIACVSAVSAVVFRSNAMVIGGIAADGHVRPSIFRMDRLGQMMVNRPDYEDAVRRFDALVPADATVAVCLPPESFEYPLFGDGLTRRLLPINSFRRGRLPIPAEAGYLLYADGLEARQPGDVLLGADWYLRRR